MDMDAIDTLAAEAFDGYIVRKDLVRRFTGQYPVPTYVCRVPARPLLRQHRRGARSRKGCRSSSGNCATGRSAAGEEELFKARARESGSVKIIDIVTARLDAKTDSLPRRRCRACS